MAVDIDGTLGDYHRAFSQFCFRYFDISPVPDWNGTGEFEDHIGITKVQYREAKLAYRQGGNKRWLPAFPGAASFMHELKALGLEVWVATTRPWQRLDNIDPDTREWLRRYNILIDGLLFGENKYLQLCDAVEKERVLGVVDDLPEQIDRAADLGLRPIQVARLHNSQPTLERYPRGTLAQASKLIAERLIEWRERV